MIRVTNNLRFGAFAVLCAAIVGCGSSNSGDDSTDMTKWPNVLKVVFSPMYSAYDGTHDYKIPATIDSAALDPNGTDPVMMDTMKWIVDSKFVASEKYDALPGGVMLTMKKAGTTTVTVTGKTKLGTMVKGTAMLNISAANPGDWDLGEMRYNNNVMIDFTKLAPMGGMMMGGVPDISTLIPRDSSCANCHNNNSTMALTVEHTPQQTGGYSDEDLINIFTKGMKPEGTGFHSPILKMIPMQFAMQIYVQLHTWDIAPEVAQGVVLKLRSIPPAPQPDIDFTRLRMMFMGMNGQTAGMAPAAGAAGTGM
jgi:hypothetical protein